MRRRCTQIPGMFIVWTASLTAHELSVIGRNLDSGGARISTLADTVADIEGCGSVEAGVHRHRQVRLGRVHERSLVG